MQEQFGGERSAFEGEISTLEDQLNKLQIDKELAIAQGDEQRVAELAQSPKNRYLFKKGML
jgi:hypothetical protein